MHKSCDKKTATATAACVAPSIGAIQFGSTIAGEADRWLHCIGSSEPLPSRGCYITPDELSTMGPIQFRSVALPLALYKLSHVALVGSHISDSFHFWCVLAQCRP